MRPILLTLAAASLSLGTAACHDTAGTEPSPAGTYALVTVNGKAPPQLVARNANGDLEVMSATLVLKNDGTYASTYVYRAVANPSGNVEQTTRGAWTVNGATVTYRPDGSSPSSVSTMRWDGATLTLDDPAGSVPVTLVFRR